MFARKVSLESKEVTWGDEAQQQGGSRVVQRTRGEQEASTLSLFSVQGVGSQLGQNRGHLSE